MGSPTAILKAIILDAVVQNAERDSQMKLTVTLLLSSALPHIELGPEASVLQPILNQLIDDVEIEAEARWSMPADVRLPEMPSIELPQLSARINGVKVDVEELQAGLERASGPSNAKGEALKDNQFWPNQNQHQQWVHAFAPLASEAISTAIGKVAGARTVTVKADELVTTIGGLVEQYTTVVVERLTAASLGVEVRSRLLWWKEAKISPKARVEYRSLPPAVIPALMAFDFQSMLPALAPASVVAFLRESVRSVYNEGYESTVIEYLVQLAGSEAFAPYRSGNQRLDSNINSFTDLAEAGVVDADFVEKMSLFSPKLKLSAEDLAMLVFTELQARKAATSINPIKPAEEELHQQVGEEVENAETET